MTPAAGEPGHYSGVIEVGPLTLRPWEPADAAYIFDACQDEDIQRWTTVSVPYTAGHAAGFVKAHARPQPEDDGAYFAIMLTDTGELLGSISVNHFDRATGEGEIGYWLGRDGRGRGAATQALDGLARWAFATLGLERVHCRIAPGNSGSIAVALRAGFVADGRQAGACHDGSDVTDALVFVRRAPAA
ncbi:MAG TPA: GNAT family N-acetyltransferase [Acidimicrobiales bacterium]